MSKKKKILIFWVKNQINLQSNNRKQVFFIQIINRASDIVKGIIHSRDKLIDKFYELCELLLL